eukprot:TRINITY_DN1014_c0_g1_i1.p1 TRINITY_DN1014_c0_g1~~TRINITY_DN1014_c0_g1_i1.p1  ORF type:complete len:404 (+),score=66.24 TRINITY_DN1014_c0_g1_i1:63-1274(+)
MNFNHCFVNLVLCIILVLLTYLIFQDKNNIDSFKKEIVEKNKEIKDLMIGKFNRKEIEDKNSKNIEELWMENIKIMIKNLEENIREMKRDNWINREIIIEAIQERDNNIEYFLNNISKIENIFNNMNDNFVSDELEKNNELDISIDFQLKGKYSKGDIYDYNNEKYNYKTHSYIPMDEKKLLITGTGRSGTTYMSSLFKSKQVNLSHEKLKEDSRGLVSWYHGVYSNSYPWGATRLKPRIKNGYLDYFNIVLHQIRDPEKVVSSSTTFTEKSWDFVNQFIRNDSRSNLNFEYNSEEDLLRISMAYYIDWNKHIETFSSYRYQFEKAEYEDICRLGGFNDLCFQEDIPDITLNSAHRFHQDYTFDDFFKVDYDLALELYNLAIKYGYSYDIEIPNRFKIESFRK